MSCLHALCGTLSEDMWRQLDVEQWYDAQNIDFRVAQDEHGPTTAVAIPLIISGNQQSRTGHRDMLTETCFFQFMIRGCHKLLVVFEDLILGLEQFELASFGFDNRICQS